MFRKLFGLGKSNKKKAEKNQYNVDIECNYCPKCGDEYRAEIETCATCVIPLLSGSDKLAMLIEQETNLSSRSMEISTDDELVTIHGGKLTALKSLQHLLKAEYVPSLLASDNASKGGGGPDLQLKVKVADAERAIEILKRDYFQSTGLTSDDLALAGAVFDTGMETVVCPACSTRFEPTSQKCPDCGLQFG